jgi:O-antigen/teichoic acid export membrane protein
VILLVTPYLFRRLGTAGFGTYSVAYTFVSLFSLIEVSYANGISKIAAGLVGRGRRDELVATLATAVALAALLGLVALACSAAIGLLGSGLADAGDRGAFELAMVVFGLVMVVRLPCMVYAAALMGHQRYDLLNAPRIAGALGLGAGTVAAVEAGAGLEGALLALAGSLLGEALLVAALMRRMDPALPLAPRLGRPDDRRRILSFSSYLLLADAAIFAGQRIQPVVIAAVRNATTAAPFAAAVKLQTGMQSAVYPFVDLLVPMVSDLEGRGRRGEIARRLSLSTRAALQIALPLGVGIALFSADVVDVWLGDGAPEVTADIIVVLMAVQVVSLTAIPSTKVLIGLGRVRLIAALAALEGVCNLVLAVILVSAHGAIGAAIPILITTVAVGPAMLPLACRAAGASTREIVQRGLAPAIASSVPGLVGMLLVHALMPESAARLTVGLGVGLGLSAAVAVRQVGTARLRSVAAELRLRRPAPVELT